MRYSRDHYESVQNHHALQLEFLMLLCLSFLWWSQQFFASDIGVVCSLIFRPSHYLCVDKEWVSEFPSSNINYQLCKPTSRGFKNSAIRKFCNLIWERGGNVGLLCVCSNSVCSTRVCSMPTGLQYQEDWTSHNDVSNSLIASFSHVSEAPQGYVS